MLHGLHPKASQPTLTCCHLTSARCPSVSGVKTSGWWRHGPFGPLQPRVNIVALDTMLAGTVNHLTWHKQTNKLAFQWEVARLSTATVCTCGASGNEKDRNGRATASNEMEMSTGVLQRGAKWEVSNWPGVFITCKACSQNWSVRSIASQWRKISSDGNDIFSSHCMDDLHYSFVKLIENRFTVLAVRPEN